MGQGIATVASICTTPLQDFIYYVLNDMTCHSECGSSEACFACECETEAQEPLEGGDTSVQVGSCCFIRHRE